MYQVHFIGIIPCVESIMREEHLDKLKLLQVRYKYKTRTGVGGTGIPVYIQALYACRLSPAHMLREGVKGLRG